ncbi:hypothetical protein U616_02139 [Staphylococcus aureus F50076]|nr:hypothetical protein U616_02139 [Staphylococcus aureus F50076]EWI25432.1 hypothetical protein U513_02162 [Staphylococcus aureus F20105]EWX34036.1 hypothetical protein V340_02765 [Staphylococcus aureus F92047]
MSITILLLIVLGYMIFDILIEGYLKANNANRADMYKWGGDYNSCYNTWFCRCVQQNGYFSSVISNKFRRKT